MLPSLVALLVFLGPPEPVGRPAAYLFHMQVGDKARVDLCGEPYHAAPGDIVLFDDHNRLMRNVYRWAGSGRPLHAGIVFRQPDGTMATLEAGTNAVMRVFIFEQSPRFQAFDGTILVRRLRKPLSEQQCKQLAQFAHAQEGKSYAIGRLALQATPLRPRGSLLAQYLGRTVVDRDRWICSELVVAALANVGVWEREAYPANMMYPRDLCYDERFDLSPYYEAPALWYPRARLDKAGSGVRVGAPK